MHFIKAKVSKIILALLSVGIVILLMFPASLSATHFRYGTLSWDLVDNDTIRLKGEMGWNAGHGSWDQISDYAETSLSTFVGSVRNYLDVTWGGGSPTSSDMHHKILSRSGSTTSDSVITQMGTESSGWTEGLTHNYDNGTYTIYWGSADRTSVHSDQSGNGLTWRNETLVRIGGDFVGNVSPVSAVPDTVRVQDNKTFSYQVSATDANGDNLTYRWGLMQEFFVDNGTGNTDKIGRASCRERV